MWLLQVFGLFWFPSSRLLLPLCSAGLSSELLFIWGRCLRAGLMCVTATAPECWLTLRTEKTCSDMIIGRPWGASSDLNALTCSCAGTRLTLSYWGLQADIWNEVILFESFIFGFFSRNIFLSVKAECSSPFIWFCAVVFRRFGTKGEFMVCLQFLNKKT